MLRKGIEFDVWEYLYKYAESHPASPFVNIEDLGAVLGVDREVLIPALRKLDAEGNIKTTRVIDVIAGAEISAEGRVEYERQRDSE